MNEYKPPTFPRASIVHIKVIHGLVLAATELIIIDNAKVKITNSTYALVSFLCACLKQIIRIAIKKKTIAAAIKV